MTIDNTGAIAQATAPQIPSSLSADDEVKLREQTDAFEAFLLKQVLDISLKNENKLFGKDPGDKIYQSMYNDTMSKSLSGGMGFSEILFNYLKENA
ncbi:MAG TPA: rod-binding protein [Campylobacterales bacterium]|nr:rod-binding protein [Campylobacterales bacterium]